MRSFPILSNTSLSLNHLIWLSTEVVLMSRIFAIVCPVILGEKYNKKSKERRFSPNFSFKKAITLYFTPNFSPNLFCKVFTSSSSSSVGFTVSILSILFFKKNVTLTTFLSLSQTTSCLTSCFQEIDRRMPRPILHHDTLLTEIFEPLLGGILGQAEKKAQVTNNDESVC